MFSVLAALRQAGVQLQGRLVALIWKRAFWGFFFSSFNSFVVFIDLANVNFRKIIVCKTRDGMEFLCLDLSVLCAN